APEQVVTLPAMALLSDDCHCEERGDEAISGNQQAGTRDCFASLAMTPKAKTRTGMDPTRERAVEELRQMVCKALGDHDAGVWLFGSSARGQVRQHSDIDIAILPRD